ncbi:putative membrane protein YedE/YeeE [Pantoea alhagi]|uniref:YeeE/YedE family protein n=1 Tax=Mixta sp. BE291 TaxID=3158787 RepID=UPI0028672577|nr:putative membrane protein YedE/YeeE [Pantoea alhagi]
MSIDWGAFTPLSSLAGGVLIGASAGILFFFCGRIAGISGILGGLLTPRARDKSWRAAFIIGMLLSTLLYSLFSAKPHSAIDASSGTLIIAGLLVGFGTRYGSGCTSGHGVCGLSRLSWRSLIATAIFMVSAMFTVWLSGRF